MLHCCLQHVVFGIAGTFLYHMEGFRMYSTFCSSHYKIKQLLQQQPAGEGQFQESGTYVALMHEGV